MAASSKFRAEAPAGISTPSVWVIFLIALAVRLPMLGYSFFGDESFTLLRDTNQLVTASEDRFRPVFFSLMYVWRQIGFHGEVGLRLLPLLFGLAQIPFAFLLGRKLGGHKLGLTLAALIALSPMLIEFSQELRMYSLVALLALVQVWILLLLFEKQTPARWIAFVVVGIIGVYSHLHYWLFLAGMGLTFIREWRAIPWWKGYAALGGIAAVYALNYPNILRFIEVRGGEYAAHFASALPKLLAAFVVGFNYFKLPEQEAGRAIGAGELAMNGPLILLVAIPAVIILWHILRLHTRSENLRTVMLSHELFTVPVLLALVASVVTGKYWLQAKYLIFSVPFLLLLIAAGLLAVRAGWLRWIAAGSGTAVVFVALLHFWNPQEYGRRENWRAAADVLRKSVRLESKSRLVLLPGIYWMLPYYAPELESQWLMVAPPKTPAEIRSFEANLHAKLADAADIYYLRWDTPQNINDPRDLLPLALDNFARRTEVIRYNPRFQLYHWTK